MIHPMPRHADRYLESQLPLAEPRNLGWFIAWRRAFIQRQSRLVNFIATPFIIVLLLSVFLKEEMDLWMLRLDAHNFDRVAVFAIKCMAAAIVFIVVFDALAAMAAQDMLQEVR